MKRKQRYNTCTVLMSGSIKYLTLRQPCCVVLDLHTKTAPSCRISKGVFPQIHISHNNPCFEANTHPAASLSNCLQKPGRGVLSTQKENTGYTPLTPTLAVHHDMFAKNKKKILNMSCTSFKSLTGAFDGARALGASSTLTGVVAQGCWPRWWLHDHV